MAHHAHQFWHLSVSCFLKELISGMLPFSCKHRVNSASTIKHFICYVYLLYTCINIYIRCQWHVLFLPWVINIYLIDSKDRICGTKTIIFMNASLEYVKIQKLFYFWCFWSMKQKSYQLLTSFFNSTLTFSASIFFKNTTLPTSENLLYTWRVLPPQAVNEHFEKVPHRFCSAATGVG